MTWKEIREGYGLSIIGNKALVCIECGTSRELYTDQSTKHDGTKADYGRMIQRVQKRVWCKTHAKLYFGD